MPKMDDPKYALAPINANAIAFGFHKTTKVNQYYDLSNLVGTKGDKGDKGDKGEQGVPGVDGADGANGSAGPAGPPGAGLVPDEYTSPTNLFNEAKVAQVEAANIDWTILVGVNEDTRVNKAVPTGVSGDVSRHIIKFLTVDNSWHDYGPIVGVAGPAGPSGTNGTNGTNGSQGIQGNPGTPGTNGTNGSNGPMGRTGVPDAYGNLDATKLAQIATANVDWLYVVVVDNRSDKATPSSLNGDLSRYLIHYDAVTNTFAKVGPWTGPTGAPGVSQVSVETIIARAAGAIAIGGYPASNYVGQAFISTKLHYQSGSDGGATFRVVINGVMSALITATNVKTTIDFPNNFAIGDEIIIGVESATTKYLAVTISMGA